MTDHLNRVAAIKIAVAMYCADKGMPAYAIRLAQESALSGLSYGHSAFRAIAAGKGKADSLQISFEPFKDKILGAIKNVGEPVSIMEICWLCGANSDESELVAEYVQNLVTERKIKRVMSGDRVVYQISEVEV